MKRLMRFLGTGLLPLCSTVVLGGCNYFPLLSPKGPIGSEERLVIFAAVALMLIVVIPVIAMVWIFPRKYRATNTKATYMPKWSSSARIELVIWLVPALIVAAMSTMIWITTHRLDPYKAIDSDVPPIRIEVVSLDWKWLFIYPDQKIATVNELVFPAKVPLSFRLTSDTVMTSFFIPRLGSQIYAMAGMQTRLHLLADEAGTYEGHNQQFSGEGYAWMNFEAVATPSREAFEAWVQKIRQSPQTLDFSRYLDISKPSAQYPATHFSDVQNGLFDHIMHQFNQNMEHHPDLKPQLMTPGVVKNTLNADTAEES